MAICDHCGTDIAGLSWDCNYCTGSYCRDHRFPENHNCPGVGHATTHGPDFRGDNDHSAAEGAASPTTSQAATNASEFDTGGSGFLVFLLVVVLLLGLLVVGWYGLSMII
jgi:hypothetical protein